MIGPAAPSLWATRRGRRRPQSRQEVFATWRACYSPVSTRTVLQKGLAHHGEVAHRKNLLAW